MKLLYTKYPQDDDTIYVIFFWSGCRSKSFHGNVFPPDTKEGDLIAYARNIAASDMSRILQEMGSTLSFPEQFEVELLVDPTGQFG